MNAIERGLGPDSTSRHDWAMMFIEHEEDAARVASLRQKFLDEYAAASDQAKSIVTKLEYVEACFALYQIDKTWNALLALMKDEGKRESEIDQARDAYEATCHPFERIQKVIETTT